MVLRSRTTHAPGALGVAYRGALRRLRGQVSAQLAAAGERVAALEPPAGRSLETLLACGERGLADRLLTGLLASQAADGSWPAPAGRSPLRETADAVRGLSAACPSRPVTGPAIRKGCGWLLAALRPQGGCDATDALAAGAALDVAGASLGVDEWRRAAVGVVRGLAWPERAVGQAATAPAVAHALDDTLGLLPDPQALATLLAVGEDAEPPAATAAFLDLVHRWVAAAFARQVDDFEDHIQRGDGRFAFLMREAGPLAARRVLDAGCGRGALTRAMLTAEPSALLTALDLSPAMLACLPLAARAVPGSLQSLPFPDASFDVAFAVESLEHAANPEGAVDELCRVVRPGGRVLIVDKNAQRAGVLPVEAWESWFHRDEVEAWLCRHCASVRSTPLVHCPELGVDLFVGWSGTRC